MTWSLLSPTPLMPTSLEALEELSLKNIAEDCLTTTFKWLRLVNQHLKYTSQEVQ